MVLGGVLVSKGVKVVFHVLLRFLDGSLTNEMKKMPTKGLSVKPRDPWQVNVDLSVVCLTAQKRCLSSSFGTAMKSSFCYLALLK